MGVRYFLFREEPEDVVSGAVRVCQDVKHDCSDCEQPWSQSASSGRTVITVKEQRLDVDEELSKQREILAV